MVSSSTAVDVSLISTVSDFTAHPQNKLKATTPISLFNQQFNTQYAEKQMDTIAGLIINQLGHIPKRNDIINIDEFTFRVVRADRRRIHLLSMKLKNL